MARHPLVERVKFEIETYRFEIAAFGSRSVEPTE